MILTSLPSMVTPISTSWGMDCSVLLLLFEEEAALDELGVGATLLLGRAELEDAFCSLLELGLALELDALSSELLLGASEEELAKEDDDGASLLEDISSLELTLEELSSTSLLLGLLFWPPQLAITIIGKSNNHANFFIINHLSIY